MNFFGHSVIAAHVSENPAFVFGSMVPDFATMSGARLGRPEGTDASLHRGVAIHHLTDAVFHVTDDFVHFNHVILKALEARDVRRGTAMAVGHIGAELLLDRAFVRQGRSAPYLSAIREANGHPPLGVEYIRGEDGKARYGSLLERLQSYGEGGYEVATIVQRLERALAGRTRLAMHAEDRPAVLEVLESYARPIEARSLEWRRDILEGLKARDEALRAVLP